MTEVQFRRASIDPRSPHPCPPDWPEIKDRVVAYLAAAPAIAVARSREDDLISGQSFVVPLAMVTDGTWIWPAAVEYYAQEHDLAPEPEFLQHLRDARFTLPDLAPEQVSAATAALRQ